MGEEHSAVRDILRAPSFVAEVRELLPLLESRAQQPAGNDGVKEVIGRRLALFPPAQMSKPEWDAWWSDYFNALKDIPASAIEAGMSAYIRDPKAEFMPKPGKLRQLALDTPNAAITAYGRARKVMAASRQQEPAAPRERADPALVKAMMEDYRSKVLKRPEPAPLPPVHEAVDETGITAEMRASLARR